MSPPVINASSTRESLFERGMWLLTIFCDENDLPVPTVLGPTNVPAVSTVSQCAFYRPGKLIHRGLIKRPEELAAPVEYLIAIAVARCSQIGHAGRSWSYPGHWIDRTPYGVLQHELGHHVDYVKGGAVHEGSWEGALSRRVALVSGEDGITSYGHLGDQAEWFAEMMRLFITNPDLLRILRPRTYAAILDLGLKPVVNIDWEQALQHAPRRTLEIAQKKVGPLRA